VNDNWDSMGGEVGLPTSYEVSVRNVRSGEVTYVFKLTEEDVNKYIAPLAKSH